MPELDTTIEYVIGPNLDNKSLSVEIIGKDHRGNQLKISVIEEKPLTIYLNAQEVVTSMTIGDYPEYLALGFLKNQNMIKEDDIISSIDFDEETESVIVRTKVETNYEEKLKKRIRTSGCAVGTIFGDIMDGLEKVELPYAKIKVSWLYELAKKINRTPSLYLEVGAIHGTVLCEEDHPIVYMEDVGRHNAVDKVAGWMALKKVTASNKILYTTGRLTSEMVLKCAQMGIPVLISRSGFTAWGVQLAKKVNMTVIGRLRGQRFSCLSGEDRLIYDVDIEKN